MELPDCPACDASASLQKERADRGGLVWCYCTVCSATVLVNAKGHVLQVRKV